MKNKAGFLLVELLLGLLLASIVLAAAVGVFATQGRTYNQLDLAALMEDNVRMATGTVVDRLRTGRYGVPTSNLSTWIPWVSSFTANPKITGTAPATISIASCFQAPVASLSASTAVGETTLPVASKVPGQSIPDVLNPTTMSLIFIGDSENARITSVDGSSIVIDTDPATVGVHGLSRAYPAGTPICRVDVHTFSIFTDPIRGLPSLGLDLNQGAGTRSVAEGISGLSITAVTDSQYLVTLTARSDTADPVTKTYITGTRTSNVTLKN